MRFTAIILSAVTATLLALAAVVPAAAATTVVVTPTNTHGWSTADTRPGGTVTFEADATTPGGSAALQLATDLTVSAKAQYLHAANTPLADITELSYYTRQISATFPEGAASYQVISCLQGSPTATTCPGFTTLVFEPYQNPLQGPVVNNVWQQWDVDAGLFWSTRTVACSNGTIIGTPGGPATYTLAQVNSRCPGAVVAGFGVNIGTFNPGYTVRTDLVDFNGTIYDFELTNVPTDKNQCKNGGYVDFTDADGQPFKNQGQCIKAANHDRGGGGGGG
jgi:hypothetical protein